MENDIVLFMDGNIQLEVPVSRDGESVWLSANQMAVLFEKDETNIRKHINNIFRSSEVDKDNNTQKMRVDGVKQPVYRWSRWIPSGDPEKRRQPGEILLPACREKGDIFTKEGPANLLQEWCGHYLRILP